jgi:hypothetical protein
MRMATKTMIWTISLITLFLSACKADVSRNSDGSITIETTVSQEDLQDVITASIADPLVKDVTVSFQQGYVLVSGERARLNDNSRTDTLSFRFDMGVANGQLTTLISDAKLDGIPIEQDRVDLWNERINNRLARQPQRNTTLQSLLITPEAITMAWLVSK